MTRGRPCASPRARSTASMRSQPSYVTTSTPRSARRSSRLLPDGSGEHAGARVLEEQVDRLGRVLLVRPDHAGRAALDPAGAVEAGDRRARVVERRARRRSGSCPTARRTARPGSPTPRYPTLRNTIPQGITSRSSVATARIRPDSSASSGCGRARSPRRDPPRGCATGEAAKAEPHGPGLALRAHARPARGGSRRSAGRRWRRPRARPALAGSSSSSAGSRSTSAPASSPSSPSSADVHAACTGPRRPMTRISRIPAGDDRRDRRVGRVGRRELLAASARACARRRARRSRSR